MRIWSAALALLLCVFAAWAEIAIPPLTAWVTDLTQTLTVNERATLEARLEAYSKSKGAQVAVLLIPSTAGEAIESFALRAAEAWKLGRENVDDGALLVIAKYDRRLRIEVGYGLEGVLNDATSKRIIDETIAPYFRSGDFYAGVNAGVERMLSVIDGEALPAPAAAPTTSSREEALSLGFFFALFFALLFRGRGRRPNPLRVPLSAISSGGMTYLLTTVAFAAGISAFAAVVLSGLLGGMGGGGANRWASRRRYGNDFPGGFGGWGGGGFGGGGGGGFGGGGASGSW